MAIVGFVTRPKKSRGRQSNVISEFEIRTEGRPLDAVAGYPGDLSKLKNIFRLPTESPTKICYEEPTTIEVELRRYRVRSSTALETAVV